MPCCFVERVVNKCLLHVSEDTIMFCEASLVASQGSGCCCSTPREENRDTKNDAKIVNLNLLLSKNLKLVVILGVSM